MTHIQPYKFKFTKQGALILNLLGEIKAAPLEVRIRVLKDINDNVFLKDLKGREKNIGRYLLGGIGVHSRDKMEANKLISKYKEKV